MLDAFRGGYVPFHLMTKEFLTECKQLLGSQGVLVSNMRTDFETYPYQRRTLKAVFPTCQAFGNGNTIVCGLVAKALASGEELKKRAQTLQAKHDFAFDLVGVAASRERAPAYEEQGKIFTDDYAPANILRRK
jgi:spermidine synthase